MSKWNGRKFQRMGAKTTTLLRMILTCSEYAELDHDEWKWYDSGAVRCSSKEVRDNMTIYASCSIDFWKSRGNVVLERRRQRQSYMNAILKRRINKVKKREKENDSAFQQ